MTETGVIQVKQGIGDVIWHLPFIKAIAAASPGGQVTFFSLPSSHAGEILQAEPCIAQTLYFEHLGSDLQRGLHLLHLTKMLRRARLRRIWILDRTIRPALAAWAAGIPERIGLGFGTQRFFVTNPAIDQIHYHAHPIDSLKALMAAMRVPLAGTEPNLNLPPPVIDAVAGRYRDLPRPWIVIGIGAGYPIRDWPDGFWIELVNGLHRLSTGTIFLIGGAHNAPRAQDLISRSGNAAINACEVDLIEAAALLQHSDLFIGADSGPMNLAAAVGTQAFGLFGVNQALNYSKFIHAIQPKPGPGPQGMLQISPAQVLERITPYLSSNRAAQ